ncbi:MAG: IS66 family transposase zinc-finger binding domain-containing protein [Alphaproteobacteria bacterium]|nr:IS66 family transposase zinc-finger binding domain-containing protein [Alphaproteobacteria bacterium]
MRQVDSPIARAHHSGQRLWLHRVRADHNRHSPRRARRAQSSTGHRAPGPPGGRGSRHWRRGDGRASQTGHRQIAARALRAIGRARPPAARPARAAARGAGGECHRRPTGCHGQAAEAGTTVTSFTRKKPVRAPFPEHLPRERVVVPAPITCPCCGGKLAKLGEDITETLEVVPRQWKVVQTVREKFTPAFAGAGSAAAARKSPSRRHPSTPLPAAAPAPACWR